MARMRKISLSVPADKVRDLRVQAKERNIPLSRVAAQAITADKLMLLAERQWLRQQVFELRAELATLKGGDDNANTEVNGAGEEA